MTMVIWHLTPDTPRFPFFVSAGQNVNLQVGTWPIEAGQPGRIRSSSSSTPTGLKMRGTSKEPGMSIGRPTATGF